MVAIGTERRVHSAALKSDIRARADLGRASLKRAKLTQCVFYRVHSRIVFVICVES
jgi:hypothetical protein